MLLGFVATSESPEKHLIGLVTAASARGWQCRCFLTDLGVRLLRSAKLIEMVNAGALSLTICEHSWEMFGSGEVPPGVIMASQYQNAELAHLCDRVIVL